MASLDNKYSDYAILLLRLGVGYIFIVHGWGKLTGIEGTAGFFGGLGIPIPLVMAWVVAIVEFFGGIMVIVGAYTKIVNLLLAITMAVAIIIQEGNFEIELILFLVTFSLFLTGSGNYSIDHKIASR